MIGVVAMIVEFNESLITLLHKVKSGLSLQLLNYWLDIQV